MDRSFSQPLFIPRDLGLILSYKCLAGCDHCIYNCGSDWNDWMDPDSIVTALEVAKSWGTPLQVHITGGEPFLNFPLLLHAVEAAAELQIPVYVETNASWCVRDELVIERFRALDVAGLQFVLISCSPFHAASIPPERTVRAIRQATQLFGSRRVLVYQAQWLPQIKSFGMEATNPLEKYAEVYGRELAGRLFWQDYGLMGGGRCGYRLGSYVSRRMLEQFAGLHCAAELLQSPHSHFDLYGNFIPGFCGGLTLGPWREHRDLQLSYVQKSLPQIVQILLEQGPHGLAQYAAERYGFAADEDGYADKCHLCTDVRRHLRQRGSFSSLQPDAFYDNF